MSNTICLPTEHYMLLMLFFIALTLFYIYKMQNVNSNLSLNNNSLDMLSKQLNVLEDIPIIPKSIGVTDVEKRIFLENRDKEAIYNELKPPEKRLPEYQYPNRYVKNMINIPTRGLPDNYHAMGTLIRKEDEKILQLYGRQTYPGSNQWEYYVTGADTYGFPNKMPISVKGGREIYDKQKIDVHFLDKKKGDFEANIYNFDVPRYNPYDY
jgi:predicted RND superfamily exporter protein